MAEADPDSSLVQLAQQGNARAFEALVVKYQRRIARHVARHVRHAGEVEEVVQETFMKAYRGLPSFRGDSSFYSWLYRIASNTAFSHLRRGHREEPLADADDERGEPFEPGVTDAESPERTLMASQMADAVRQGLQRMPAELADALTLFEVEGKSYPEIAQMLDIPVGTVRSRIFRAREALARRLQPLLAPQRTRRW
jgi:RNA polymerase sigma-70 factor (ECF subfamily)